MLSLTPKHARSRGGWRVNGEQAKVLRQLLQWKLQLFLRHWQPLDWRLRSHSVTHTSQIQWVLPMGPKSQWRTLPPSEVALVYFAILGLLLSWPVAKSVTENGWWKARLDIRIAWRIDWIEGRNTSRIHCVTSVRGRDKCLLVRRVSRSSWLVDGMKIDFIDFRLTCQVFEARLNKVQGQLVRGRKQEEAMRGNGPRWNLVALMSRNLWSNENYPLAPRWYVCTGCCADAGCKCTRNCHSVCPNEWFSQWEKRGERRKNQWIMDSMTWLSLSFSTIDPWLMQVFRWDRLTVELTMWLG